MVEAPKIIFINSHPIQYFAPLYKYMNEQGVKTAAWYCSDASIKGMFDKQFGVEVKWDIDLLDGYGYKFFKNQSWKPSHYNGFFGLINFGIFFELFRIPKSVIIVHGWHYFTHFLTIFLASLKGHTVCIRVETPFNQEKLKTGLKYRMKRFFLRHVLFKFPSYFLYIGFQNKLFYESCAVPESKLLFCPYSVDNERFSREYRERISKKVDLKRKLNIPIDDKVIVYAGKYIDKKKPLDLLQAYSKVENSNLWLIMVGEGILRQKIESFIQIEKLERVMLTGFINQSEIADYYTIGDVFVMCSTTDETWGLSVNEAMNFDMPIILSELTGSSADLVKEGINGFVYPTGDIDALSRCLEKTLIKNELKMIPKPSEIIKEYSYDVISNNVKSLLLSIKNKKYSITP